MLYSMASSRVSIRCVVFCGKWSLTLTMVTESGSFRVDRGGIVVAREVKLIGGWLPAGWSVCGVGNFALDEEPGATVRERWRP